MWAIHQAILMEEFDLKGPGWSLVHVMKNTNDKIEIDTEWSLFPDESCVIPLPLTWIVGPKYCSNLLTLFSMCEDQYSRLFPFPETSNEIK